MNKASKAFGARVQSTRRALGLTVLAASSKLGLALRTWRRIETGHLDVSIPRIAEIAFVLECEPAALLEGVSAQDPSQPISLPKNVEVGCSECLVPRSGSGLRRLLDHLESDHELDTAGFAHALGVKPATLVQYTYKDKDEFPEAMTERISRLLRGKKRKRKAKKQCHECFMPRSGNGLRELLDHLEDRHSVSFKKLAKKCNLKESTLGQYQYRQDGDLPKAFRERMRSFLSEISGRDAV